MGKLGSERRQRDLPAPKEAVQAEQKLLLFLEETRKGKLEERNCLEAQNKYERPSKGVKPDSHLPPSPRNVRFPPCAPTAPQSQGPLIRFPDPMQPRLWAIVTG